MLLHMINLCAYMLCHTPLSNHMLCLMTTLVWWITSWMLGFALTLTTFVFPSVCYTCSFWRNHKTVWHWWVPFWATRRWVLGDRPLQHGTAISFPWWFGFRSEVGSFPRGRGWCGASYGHHHVKSPFGKWHMRPLLHIHKGESSPLHVLTWPLRGWYTTWPSIVHA